MNKHLHTARFNVTLFPKALSLCLSFPCQSCLPSTLHVKKKRPRRCEIKSKEKQHLLRDEEIFSFSYLCLFPPPFAFILKMESIKYSLTNVPCEMFVAFHHMEMKRSKSLFRVKGIKNRKQITRYS